MFRRVLSILILLCMLTAITPTALAKGEAGLDYRKAAKAYDLNVNERPKSMVSHSTKDIQISTNYYFVGASTNLSPNYWIDFYITDLSDVGTIKVLNDVYAACCYDQNGKIYIMTTSCDLYTANYNVKTGKISTLSLYASFADAATQIGRPTAMCYNRQKNRLYIIFNGIDPYYLDLGGSAVPTLYVQYRAEYGIMALDTAPNGTTYVVDAYGVLCKYDFTTGEYTDVCNTGIVVTESGKFSFQAGCIKDNYFFWNATSVSGEARFVVVDYTNGQYAVAPCIYQSPGINLAGIFCAPPPEEEESFAPDEFDVFYENWQLNETVSRWTTEDKDKDGLAWTQTLVNTSEFYENGNRVAISRSSKDGETLAPEDWLTSPEIQLPEANSYLSFWIGAAQPVEYTVTTIYEKYELYISVDGEETLLESVEITEKGVKHREIDLGEYASKKIKLIFVHNGTIDKQTGLILDTVGIGTIKCFHNVTFIDTYDNSVVSEQVVRHGKHPKYPKKPSHEGMTFIEWDYGGGIIADIIIYSVYEGGEFDILYYIDGTLYDTVTVQMGTKIQLLPEPTKTGYTFSGWSEAPEIMPAQDIEIHGTFTANEYNITFVDGFDNTVISQVKWTYDTELVFPEAPTHSGYSFIGWDKDVKDIVGDTTITAQYKDGALLGDVNGDGVVNTGDAVIILKSAANMLELNQEQLAVADVNKDGTVNTGDAVHILKYAAGMVELG